MPEHYTRNTLEVTAWCARCQRDTQHRVDGGRRGPCLECLARLDAAGAQLSKAQLARRKKAEKARQNPSLFE
jgi:hypothetical protein